MFTPEGQLSAANNFLTIETGVYGEGVNTANLVLALKTKIYPDQNDSEKHFSVLLLIKPGEDGRIWYHHPFENIWVSNTNPIWIDGVIPALETELAFALREAGYFVEEFDFVSAMEDLKTLSHSLFDKEETLPSIVSVVNGFPVKNVKNNNLGCGCYTKTEGCSNITIHYADNLELNFINTKGDYPSREMALMTKMPSFSSRVEFDKVDKNAQVYIVQVANQVLKGLTGMIETGVETK